MGCFGSNLKLWNSLDRFDVWLASGTGFFEEVSGCDGRALLNLFGCLFW